MQTTSLTVTVCDEGHLMAGFIPVPVPVFAEHRVQFLHEVIAPSHALHEIPLQLPVR